MDSSMARVCQNLTKCGIVVQSNVCVGAMSKIRCGGTVDILASPASVEQLVVTMQIIAHCGVPYYILGGGSKVLVPDGHTAGIVICTRLVKGITIDSVRCRAHVLCGTHTVVCANALAEQGLSGAEYMYCLPATVGGAVYMNAGCYGQCTADIVDSVRCMDIASGKILTIAGKHCLWGRRKSIFGQSSLLILGVNLLLTNGNKQCIIDSMKGNMASKLLHQPLDMPSLGSSHYTVEGLPASALCDRAGLKGYAIGGAEVSCRHAGFIVNNGGATSSQVAMLLDYISSSVSSRYGVQLHQEIIQMMMRG